MRARVAGTRRVRISSLAKMGVRGVLASPAVRGAYARWFNVAWEDGKKGALMVLMFWPLFALLAALFVVATPIVLPLAIAGSLALERMDVEEMEEPKKYGDKPGYYDLYPAVKPKANKPKVPTYKKWADPLKKTSTRALTRSFLSTSRMFS